MLVDRRPGAAPARESSPAAGHRLKVRAGSARVEVRGVKAAWGLVSRDSGGGLLVGFLHQGHGLGSGESVVAAKSCQFAEFKLGESHGIQSKKVAAIR